MTYCVALKLKAGLVMLADTRTNAGVDNVSRFRKMFAWEVPGERAVVEADVARGEEHPADPGSHSLHGLVGGVGDGRD